MSNRLWRKAKKSFIQQEGQSECGPTCLAIVGKYFGKDISLFHARILCGTSVVGTTLQGLLEGAKKMGFKCEGFKGSITSLKELKQPAILYTTLANGLQHFIVYIGYDENTMIFIDPANGALRLSDSDLDSIWKSKMLLTIEIDLSINSDGLSDSNSIKWLKIVEFVGIPVLFGLVVSILGYATAFYLRNIIDIVLPTKSTGSLIQYSIILFVVLVIRAIMNYYRGFVVFMLNEKVVSEILNRYINNTLLFPQIYFDGKNLSEIQGKFIEGQKLSRFYQQAISNVLVDFSMFVVTFIFLFIFINIKVSLLSIICVVAMTAMLFFNSKNLTLMQKELLKKTSILDMKFSEILHNLQHIRVAQSVTFIRSNFNQKIDSFISSSKNYYQHTAKFNFWLDVFSALILVCLLSYITFLSLLGEVATGEVIFYIFLVGTLITSAPKLIMSFIEIQEASILYKKNIEYLSSESENSTLLGISSEKEESIKEFQNLVAENISFSFSGRKPIFTNVNVTFVKGNVYTIKGKSGQGKSTFVKIITKLYQPTSGNIKVNNIDYERVNSNELMSVCLQSSMMFYGSILYNIAQSEDREVLEEAILFVQEIGALKYIDQFPYGLSTIVGAGGIEISRGQAQFVCFLRCLFSKKKLFILDEPTSSMDKELELFCCKVILDKIKKQPDVTFIIFSHNASLLELSEKRFEFSSDTLMELPKMT